VTEFIKAVGNAMTVATKSSTAALASDWTATYSQDETVVLAALAARIAALE